MRQKIFGFLLLLFILLGIFSLSNFAPASKEEAIIDKRPDSVVYENKDTSDSSVKENGVTKLESILVKRVIDGDTIELVTGQKVRYIGIDTPETVDPRTTVQCFGKEASAKNKELVEGKTVRLEKDVSETDKYGRLLRYVYVDDLLVNEVLVKEGYAFSSTYPPDVKYQDLFIEAERQAREANVGLWGSCGEVTGKTTAPTTDCVIKGNISSSGEKIYHLPGQKFYDKTVIDENRGERWFCSEEEAQKSGWRKSKT